MPAGLFELKVDRRITVGEMEARKGKSDGRVAVATGGRKSGSEAGVIENRVFGLRGGVGQYELVAAFD